MPLAETQRRLWRLLTAPSGVRAALAEAGDPEGASLAGWIAGDAACPAALRLEVYANAYFQRIHDVLADDFGALAAALGEAAFHDLATAYLCVHPPERPSLRHAGAHLAHFLEAHPAAAAFRRRWPWAADLARLETALTDAFDAPDAEPLARDDLAALPPDRWADLPLALDPSVRVVAVDVRVATLRRAFGAGEPIEAPTGRGEVAPVLVWRRSERVHFRALEAEEAARLAELRDGATFGGLCERLADVHGAEAAPAHAARRLAGWVDAGLLRRGEGPVGRTR